MRVNRYYRLHIRSLIPMLTHQTNGRSMCHADIFCKNPTAELFSEHHSQKAEQRDDGRRRTLYPDESVKGTHPETN